MHSFLNDGLSRAQANEMIAIAFVHAGPRGMQTIAEAMKGLEFPETPEIPAKFPKGWAPDIQAFRRSDEHTSEVQTLMRNSYAVHCLKKKNTAKVVCRPHIAINEHTHKTRTCILHTNEGEFEAMNP